MSGLPASYVATRDTLRRVATHVLARAQHAAIGRIALRATPGGFGTVQFGPQHERLRVSGPRLVRETGDPSGTRIADLTATTLSALAAFAGVDLEAEFSVGDDTPPRGDVDEPLRVDGAAVAVMGDSYALSARSLDVVIAGRPASAATLAQLWPEHFDLALDLAFDESAQSERRVNIGGAPGDGFHAEPYLYVGPWTPDRPGDSSYWNAPFGAYVAHGEIMAAADPLAAVQAFFDEGLARLADQPAGV